MFGAMETLRRSSGYDAFTLDQYGVLHNGRVELSGVPVVFRRDLLLSGANEERHTLGLLSASLR